MAKWNHLVISSLNSRVLCGRSSKRTIPHRWMSTMLRIDPLMAYNRPDLSSGHTKINGKSFSK